jgi:HlyD family secretion protein
MTLPNTSAAGPAPSSSSSSDSVHADAHSMKSTTWLHRVAWRRIISIGLRIMIVAAVAGGLIYWLKFAPIDVEVHRVERGSVVAEVLGTGTLEARIQATIGPKISGRLREVLVDQGSRVETGQLLVRLDDDELQQQVAVAQAGVDAAEASIERLKADHNRAEAVVAQALRKHTRVRELAEANVATEDSLDEAVEALAIAEAGISHANAATIEARKQLVVAQKTLQFQRTRLADAEIVAPFSGLIVKRHRDHGDIVVPGSAVLTLISTEELWISAWVDETEMAQLQPGQTARVVFRSESNRSYPGKVIRLGREADRETREFIVDVSVLELPKNWAVGQRAETFIEVARKDGAILLPAKLVSNRNGKAGVFVAVDEQAVWRDVSFGLRSRETVEVVEGLQTEDVVITPIDERSSLIIGGSVVMP